MIKVASQPAEMLRHMSNVVYLSFPSREHVRSSLGFVRTLIQRGEHITYYSTEPFRDEIEAAGAVFAPYAPLPEGLLEETHNSLTLSLSIIKACNMLLPALIEVLKDTRPDYMVFDSMCVWGWYAAQALNIASVSSMSRFMIDSTVLHDSGKQSAIFREIMQHLSTLREYREIADQIEQKYGVRTPNFTDILNNTGLITLVYTLPQLQPNAAALGNTIKFVGPIAPSLNGAGFPVERVQGDRPLLYISSREAVLSEFYEMCVEAFQGEAWQVIYCGSATSIPVPANFIVSDGEPSLEVLSRAALHITPGGLRDVHQALYCDVPLLIAPQTVEQSVMAEQIVSQGVGEQIELTALTPQRLREIASQMVESSSYRQKAHELGEILRAARSTELAADEITVFKQAYGL
jgi:MGT family glycosyltransferase